MSISVTGTTRRTGPQLTARQIWDAVARQSFAVLSHVTPAGAPRSSGVMYAVSDGRMYVVVAADSWKARHIAAHGKVAVTVLVRRGGVMSLVLPIPPATISFPAQAVVRSAELVRSPELAALARLVPAERRKLCSIIELSPAGHYVTYGVGVPLRRMRDTAAARDRVAVA